MRVKNYTFLFVLVISLTFLFSWTNATVRPEYQEQTTDESSLIKMGSTVVPKDKMDKVVKRIDDDYTKLSDLFRDGDYKEMAKILGDRASLRTADGLYYRGYGSIKNYWKGIIEEGKYDRVEFELVWAFISHEERKPLLKKNSDNMVYENFVYHLIETRGGEIVQNQDGGGERSGRHTQGCDWIGN